MERTDLAQKAFASFLHQFGSGDRRPVTVTAPCRLTLLGGEYTEAVDGLSLLAAGEPAVAVAAQRRGDRHIVVYSQNVDEKLRFPMGALRFERSDGWGNYPKGVLYFYERTGRKLEGVQMALVSDIPENTGLGASAALCVAVATAANLLGTHPLDDAALVKLCQRVESQFLSLRGDYFSPFACRMAREGTLLSFDAWTFKADYLPFDNANMRLVVVDSGLKGRERVEEFQKRQALFERMLPEIRKVVPKVLSLRDVGPGAFESVRRKFDILDRKRLEHVVMENERVRRAQNLLSSGDLAGFGRLLDESHESLAQKLKITSREVDLLYGIARNQRGCLGARMAGLGFGGHLVCLVEADHVGSFTEAVKREYFSQVNIQPRVVVTRAAGGSRAVEAFSGSARELP